MVIGRDGTLSNLCANFWAYLQKDCTEWKRPQIISCCGKATSKFKVCWNTQENENEPVKCIGFERDVEEFTIWDEPNLDSVVDNLSDSMQALEINVSEVLHNSITTETVEAKQKELTSWIQKYLYKEVPNEGQETFSMHWVVPPNVIDSVMCHRSKLIRKTDFLLTYNPIFYDQYIPICTYIYISRFIFQNWTSIVIIFI